MPKVLGNLQKLLRDDPSGQLSGAIAEAVGAVALHLLPEKSGCFQSHFLKFSTSLLEKASTKSVVSGSLLCLSASVRNCPATTLK